MRASKHQSLVCRRSGLVHEGKETTSPFKMTPRDIAGYVSILAIFAAAPIYCLTFLIWRLISKALGLSETAYQKGDDFVFSMYHNFAQSVFKVVAGTKLYIYGDLKELRSRKESALVILNHQSAMDWLCASALSFEQGMDAHNRFVMKGELSLLPFYGAILHYHGCIFVRRGDFHQDLMLRSLSRLNKLKLQSWMHIFAEGTRMVPEKEEQKEKSRQAAIKHGLPVLQEVLTPHYRGSWIILSNMRESMGAVYSITLAYSDTGISPNRCSAPSMNGVLRGLSNEIHCHVRRIPISKVPNNEKDFSVWMHQEFVHKDKLMKSFYQHGSAKDWGPRELQKLPYFEIHLYGILYTLVLLYSIFDPWGRTIYFTGTLVIGLCTFLYMKFAQVC